MAEVQLSPEQVQERLAVLQELLEREFPTTRLRDGRSIAFAYAAGPIPIRCYCEINPDTQAFIVRGMFALPFEPGLRGVVSEYLHRVNYPLPVGSGAINLDTGEVRWKDDVGTMVFWCTISFQPAPLLSWSLRGGTS
jgi:hypothetical protein